MLRATAKMLGTSAIATMLLITLIGVLGAPIGTTTHAPLATAPGAGPTATPSHSSLPVTTLARPLAGPSGPIEATATITSTYSGAQDVPVTVDWTISVTNTTIDPVNVSMSLLVTNGANEIANLSVAGALATTSYSMMVDYAALSSENFGGGTLPTTAYTFTVWLTAMNASNSSVAPVTVSSAPVSATLKIANVGVLLTSAPPLYTGFPFNIAFTTSYSGNVGSTVDANNATVSVEIRQIITGCNSVFGFGVPCPQIANNSIAFNSSNSYALSIDESYFLSGTYANGALPLGQYQVIVWNTYLNSTNSAQEPRSVASAAYVYIVVDPNSATFLSPSPLQPETVGNVTIAVQYVADYLSAANVTVYQGSTGTGTIVFSAGVFQAAPSVHAASAIWEATTAGTYTVVLNIVTAAGAASGQSAFSMVFNVSAVGGGTGGTVYYNQTIWKNTTGAGGQLIGGLSNGVSAALLLVVGLIVGLIVALLIGRMMWGGPKAAPAQPWQAKPGANECSVCHQSFASEAELKDHQKQAHGMQ